MTEIGEPTTVHLAPCKKRSWSTTLHGRSPLFRQDVSGGSGNNNTLNNAHPRRDRVPTKAGLKGTPEGSLHHQMAVDQKMDMQSILERYHSLALTHCNQTKRRRLESAARSTQNSQRLEQLTTLHKMAQDTLNFCTRVLRSEEHVRRENERERREVEEEMRRAEREKALAEDFLSRFGGDGGGNAANHPRPHHHRAMHHAEGRMNHAEHIENERRMIGGIPSKFLDLSHFPKLKSFHEGQGATHNVFSPEAAAVADGKQMSRPIIDCTEEIRTPSSFGIPQELSLSNNTQGKQNTKRIYISQASLSHVNGTYVQEGCYNDAPLFVRVGPPRKFMGKWDCSVVLRRENEVSKGASFGDAGAVRAKVAEHAWKIGLVPAHRITHPRIIGYYMAKEDPTKRISNVDRMEEDNDDAYDDEESFSMYLEPPVDGWKVFQVVVGGNDSNAALGRASSLRVSYEE